MRAPASAVLLWTQAVSAGHCVSRLSKPQVPGRPCLIDWETWLSCKAKSSGMTLQGSLVAHVHRRHGEGVFGNRSFGLFFLAVCLPDSIILPFLLSEFAWMLAYSRLQNVFVHRLRKK